MNAPAPKILTVAKTISAPGIFSDIPFSVYLADPCPLPSLSSGGAHTILSQSPAHCWADHPRNPKRIPGDESTDMDIGSIAHELFLEGSEARAVVVDPRDYTGSRGGVPKGWTNDAIRAVRDQARAEGKIPILVKDMERVRAMLSVARAYVEASQIADVFKKGEAEATVIACEGDLWLRARPDWITHDRKFTVHYKTTPGSAEPNGFIRGRLFSLGYDVSIAFYERAIAAACGAPPDSCILLQETKPPYACSLIGLDPTLHDIAERKVDLALRIWADCRKRGQWHAYPSQICFAEPKPWQIAEAEERDLLDPLQDEHGVQA